ncbi:MAG: hypothetical protein IPM66_11125 [Acidobacteriota bacterium]|nr:MAG: hypothetical protein IPM66_11125 [Acidobacteriota bacterium]
MKKIFLIWLAMTMLVLTVGAQAPQPVASSPEKPVTLANDLWRRTFDDCWGKVRDTHFDPTFGGVDWEDVRRRYEPRLAGLRNEIELYRLLQQMLGELGQSHFNIIPPEAVVASETKAAPTAAIGIDLRVIGDRVTISRVEKESTAAAAGLRPGFIISQVGSLEIDKLWTQMASSPESEERKSFGLVRKVLGEIGGDPETTVRIAYLDGRNRPGEAVVRREKLKGELSPPIGNFPPQYTEYEAIRLPGNVGYIRFNVFSTPVMGKVREAIRGFSAADNPVTGIIFDLRGNPGGLGGMAPGIAGMLTTEPGSLGTMKSRSTELKFAFFPQQRAFTGPVAILIDGMSASTSEIFAAGMQEIGRASVIGERSMGAALPSYIHKLPTGALLQYAIADFRTPKGVLIEGRGVVPDRVIGLDREILLAGRDAHLEAALDYIKKRSSGSR